MLAHIVFFKFDVNILKITRNTWSFTFTLFFFLKKRKTKNKTKRINTKNINIYHEL